MVKILIADDDRSIAELISDALTDEGYVTEIVGDGEQALRKIANSSEYSLILLDIILYVATQSRVTKILFPILIALLVLLLILGTRLSFHGTLLDMFLMLVPAAIGAGMLIKAAFMKEK